MSKVRIVTDSTAHFLHADTIERYKIEIVPLEIALGAQTFHENVDLDASAFFQLATPDASPAVLSAPSMDAFAAVYQRLNRETDQVLSLHVSRHLNATWTNALAASKTLLGRCEIAVIDSMSISAGLALLVETAAKVAETGADLEEVVQAVRSKLPHVYCVFFVDSLNYLQYNGLLSEAQSILGTMLDIKPFLTIEEGELIPMEKVRTQAQAIDKLVEFVAEFSALEQLIILENTPFPTDRAHQLQDRLMAEFPGRTFPTMMYGPSLGTLIGPNGMGVVVYENPNAEEDS